MRLMLQVQNWYRKRLMGTLSVMRTAAAVLCLSAIGLVLSGCPGGSSQAAPDPTIRFINTSPDSGPLDFFLDEDLEGAALAFLASTAGFKSIESGPYDIGVFDAGTQNNHDAIFVNLNRDKHYLVSAIGLVNYGTEAEKRLRLVLTEINRNAVNGNVARLIIFHAFARETGFQTPAIDFQNPGDNPQFKVENIAFASSKTLTVDAGNHDFEARRNESEHVYATANVTLGAGKIYAVFVTGIENGTGGLAPQIVFVEIAPK